MKLIPKHTKQWRSIYLTLTDLFFFVFSRWVTSPTGGSVRRMERTSRAVRWPCP